MFRSCSGFDDDSRDPPSFRLDPWKIHVDLVYVCNAQGRFMSSLIDGRFEHEKFGQPCFFLPRYDRVAPRCSSFDFHAP